MPATQRMFFATTSDLNQGLARLEKHRPVLYVETGLLDAPDPAVFESSASILNLGMSVSGDHEASTISLLIDPDTEIVTKEVPQRRGGIKFNLDCYTIPDSITVFFRGQFLDQSLIYHTVSGVDKTSKQSQSLYRAFNRLVLKDYKKIGAFWVSPEAVQWLDSGKRLTPSVKADRRMDLAR